MLKISHLQKHYRGFSLDCSMEVLPGMITGLIGRNGSGKSTTFKALLGLIHPDGGEIEVFGKKAEELKPEDKQKLGVVFADSGFSMYLTAAGVANIMKSIYPDFDREKFLQQCRRFNLPVFRGTGRSLDEELQQQWFLCCSEYFGHSALLTLAASVICPFHDFPVTQLSFSV